jgi:translocator protein
MDTYYKTKKYTKLKKSPLSPPNYVFGIVWPILYLLMSVSFFIILKKNKYSFNSIPLIVFIIHLFFNFIWTYLFQNYKNKMIALTDLSIVILLTIYVIIEFYKIDKLASYLLIPYILWLCFAFYLNLFIVINN